jgi:hypothetical protein
VRVRKPTGTRGSNFGQRLPPPLRLSSDCRFRHRSCQAWLLGPVPVGMSTSTSTHVLQSLSRPALRQRPAGALQVSHRYITEHARARPRPRPRARAVPNATSPQPSGPCTCSSEGSVPNPNNNDASGNHRSMSSSQAGTGGDSARDDRGQAECLRGHGSIERPGDRDWTLSAVLNVGGLA